MSEKENEIVIPENELESNNKSLLASDVSEIVSNDYMKEFLETMVKEFDMNKQEAMDMFYIFKDMIINSGDFDSSGSVKEQVALLLKVAQDAISNKVKLFDTLLRSKMKNQIIRTDTLNQQNNLYIGNRRDLLKEMSRVENEFKLNIKDDLDNFKKIKENEDFQIGSGDFE